LCCIIYVELIKIMSNLGETWSEVHLRSGPLDSYIDKVPWWIIIRDVPFLQTDQFPVGFGNMYLVVSDPSGVPNRLLPSQSTDYTSDVEHMVSTVQPM
jgi:hypothetical protein